MPAVICYVLADGGREVQMRVRFSQRVAIPTSDWPEPPKSLLLICPNLTAELSYSNTTYGFAVYYISSVDFDRLLDLIQRLCSVEPCRLPCVLTSHPPPS